MKIYIQLIVIYILCLYIEPSFATVYVEKPKTDLIPVLMGGDTVDADAVGAGVASIIKQIIWYTSILGVLSITYAGILYILSYGEEEKTKKAKTLIMYALIGTFASVSAYAIVDFVSKLSV